MKDNRIYLLVHTFGEFCYMTSLALWNKDFNYPIGLIDVEVGQAHRYLIKPSRRGLFLHITERVSTSDNSDNFVICSTSLIQKECSLISHYILSKDRKVILPWKKLNIWWILKTFWHIHRFPSIFFLAVILKMGPSVIRRIQSFALRHNQTCRMK